jgi:RNA polymerase sigma-70 factor (ECF subfamily)
MNTSNPSVSLDELLGHSGWARSLARSLVSDAAGADDLVQDALVAALKAPPRQRSNLRGWLARVMRNAARERARRERARPAVEGQGRVAAEALAPDALAAEREERLRLARLVRALEEPYRSTVLMRYWHGLEPTEIARQLGVPAGTVRWRLKTALDGLREDLDRESRDERRAWVLALLPLASRDGATSAAPAASWILLAGAATIAAASLAVVLNVWGPGAAPTHEAVAAVAPTRAEPASEAEALPAVESTARLAVQGKAATSEPVASPAGGAVVVRVRALDAEQRPIAGASLALSDTSLLAPSGPSGVDGLVQYTLPLGYAEPSRPTQLLLRAPARATVQLAGLVQGDSIELGEVAMEPGGGLSGRLVDPEGRPVPGAWVHARDVGEAWGELEVLQLLTGKGTVERKFRARATRADEDGRFVLDGLPVGTWRLAAGSPAHWPTLGLAQEVAAGAPREIEPLRLEAVPAERCITGRVLDAAGKPVADARVDVEWRGGLGVGTVSALCGDDGTFQVVLPSAATAVTLRAQDRERTGPEARLDDLRPGAQGVELRLVAPREFKLRVRVLGPDGAPAERSRLRAYRADAPGSDPLNPGFEREPDGVLSAKLPGVAIVLEVDAPGLRLRRLGPFEPTELAGPIECRLAPPPVVRGRATADGEPAAGARVSLWRQVRGEALHGGLPVRVEHAPIAEGECDATGAFALEVPEQLSAALASFTHPAAAGGTSRSVTVGYGELPPDAFGAGATRPVFVRLEREGCAPLERGPLDPEDAAALDLGELALTAGGTIEGRVTGVEGVEPAGAQVVATRGDARPRTFTVGEDGRFRFEHLTPGAWELRLVEPRSESAQFSTGSFRTFGGVDEGPRAIPSNCEVQEGGTTTYELVRRPLPAVLELSVLVDHGPAQGARVRWVEADEAPEPTWIEAAYGFVQLERAQPGLARVAVEGALDVRLVLDVNLQRGSNARSADVASALVDLAGFPSGAGLWLVCESPGVLGLRPIDGDARGLRVPAGRVRVARFAPGETPGPAGGETLAEAQVAPGATAELRAGTAGR